MSALSPLFKVVTDDQNNEIVYKGGGMKVAKNQGTARRNNPKFTVQGGSTSDAKLLVRYIDAFSDTFGIVLNSFTIDSNATETETLAVSFSATDILAVSPETNTVVNVLVVGSNHIEDADVINSVDEYIDIGQTIPFSSTRALVEDFHVYGSTTQDVYGSTSRSAAVINQPANPSSINNQSGNYRQLNNQRLSKQLNGALANISTGFDPVKNEMYTLYGPREYYVYVLVTDINGGGSVKDNTAIMTRTYFIHGIFDVQLTSNTNNPALQTVGGNHGNMYKLTWECSRIPSDISAIRSTIFRNFSLRKENGESLPIYPPSINISYDADSGKYSAQFTIGGSLTYQGPIYGFLQYKEISTSPLNTSTPLILSSTNAPNNADTTSLFIISSGTNGSTEILETELQVSLGDIQFATMLTRTITVSAHQNGSSNASGNSCTFTFVNGQRDNVSTRKITGLAIGSPYVIKYTVENGQINVPYTADFTTTETRYDDVYGPTVSSLVAITQPNAIKVYVTNIQDANNIQSIHIVAHLGTDNRQDTDIETNPIEIARLFPDGLSINLVVEPLSEYLNRTSDKQFVIRGYPLTQRVNSYNQLEDIINNTVYTVYVKAVDNKNNTTIRKVSVTTRANIDIQDFALVDNTMNSLDITAKIVLYDLNYEYMYAIFSANDVSYPNDTTNLKSFLTTYNSQFIIKENNLNNNTLNAYTYNVTGKGPLTNAFNNLLNITSTTPILDGRTYWAVIYARPMLSISNPLYDVYANIQLIPPFIKHDYTPPEIINMTVKFNP